MERGSYFRSLRQENTHDKDIDGSVLPRRLHRSPDKTKKGMFGKDKKSGTTYERIGFPQRVSRNENSQSEPTNREEEWLEELRFRLNQNEKKRGNKKQDGKEESEE